MIKMNEDDIWKAVELWMVSEGHSTDGVIELRVTAYDDEGSTVILNGVPEINIITRSQGKFSNKDIKVLSSRV